MPTGPSPPVCQGQGAEAERGLSKEELSVEGRHIWEGTRSSDRSSGKACRRREGQRALSQQQHPPLARAAQPEPSGP